jgi:hypothetical protein
MTNKLDDLSIESKTLPLNKLSVEYDREPSECKSRAEINLNTRVVLPDGRRMRVSDRFWLTFSSLYGLSQSVFDYFHPTEVFDRITQTKKDTVRVAFEEERFPGMDGVMLSATNPAKPLLRVDQVRELVDSFDGKGLSYAGGVATCRFDCPFPMEFEIGGDGFKTNFSMIFPLDCFGLHAAYLALLRLV